MGEQGGTNLRSQWAVATKFCVLAINTCESTLLNVLHTTFLAPRILRWFLDFWETYVSLV
jgi:hypothetical protein